MDESLDGEWKTFELYEKVRVRERRKRFWIISLVFVVFLVLCSLPVVEEQMPKWRSLHAARRLAVEIEKMKTLAIQKKQPIRMSFLETGEMKVEILKRCEDGVGTILAQQHWIPEEIKVLTRIEAQTFDLKQALDEICFDPVYGLEVARARKVVVIVPVKDLTDRRLDRASYVILDGESAKISIN